MEPDSLRVGADGWARWAPPGPGSYPTTIAADGYERASQRVEVAAGEDLALEVRLTPEPAAAGAWLGFADGRPVAGAALLPFDGDGRFRHDCVAARGRRLAGCLRGAVTPAGRSRAQRLSGYHTNSPSP